MNAEAAVLEIRIRLEGRRDYYKRIGVELDPGQQRDIYEERASMISEALVLVGEVEKLMANQASNSKKPRKSR